MVDIRHLRKIEKQIHKNKNVAASESAPVKPPTGKENKAKAKTGSPSTVAGNSTAEKKKPAQPDQPRAAEKSAQKSAAKTAPQKTEKPAEATVDK